MPVMRAPVAPERVAEGDRAAVEVHLGDVETELVDAGERLRRERLVELDDVDLVERESGARRAPCGSRAPDRSPWSPGRSPRWRRLGSAPSARRPFAAAYSSEQTRTAAAPSVTGDEVPAVTVPFWSKASLSSGEPFERRCRRAGSRRARRCRALPVIGTISSSSLPAAAAAAALRCDSTANSS